MGAARHIRARGLAGPAGASSHGPPVLRLVPSVLRGGERATLAVAPRWPWRGIAISALLHGGTLAAALWWLPASSGHNTPAVSTEIVFWPAAQVAEAPSGDLATQSAEPVPPDAASEVAATEVPMQVAALEPVPAVEPAPAEAMREPPPEQTTLSPVPVEPVLQISDVEPESLPPAQAVEPEQVAVAVPPPPPPRPRVPDVMRAKAVEPKPPRPTPRAEPVTSAPPSTQTATTENAVPVQTSTPSQVVAAAPAASGLSSEPPVIREPRYRYPPSPPRFPPRALELNQQGTVIVRALVGPDGASEAIVVWRSSGYALLDAAALRAVRGWAFEPASVGGRRIAAWVEVPVRFAIR